MSSATRGLVRALALLLAVGCAATPVADEPDLACEGKCDDATTPSAAPLRDHLLANLIAQMESPAVMFGQQRFNLTGVNPDGTSWLASPGQLDRSDASSVTGQHPIVMGFDVYDLAIKPANWTPTPATHAAAAKHVFASGGIVTLEWHMRGCAATESFNAVGNEACLCKLANDDTYARQWLIDANYAVFADALVAHGLDRIPIIFRPFHELTGNWFWWGEPYWNCAAYVANPTVTGEVAFRRLFRTVVDYLRDERGLDNLLFAFAPAPFGGANHAGAGDVARYLAGYPGDAYVDVLGIDLYYAARPSFAAETDVFRTYLDTVARAAYAHGKAAALTEVGNTKLATDATAWFTQHLQPLLADARMAFALTWENRADSYWVPYPGHPLASDFESFADSDSTLMLGDQAPLYAPPQHGYPMCTSCDVDRDGDGWGWEAEHSCRVGSWCLPR